MTSHSSIGIHDDLPSSQAGIPLGATDHEPARRIDVEYGLFIQEICRNHRTDHLCQDILPQLFHGNLRAVLGRDHNGVHPHRLVIIIFHGDLGLPVRPQISQGPVFPHLGQPAGQLMGQRNGQRHVFRSFVSGITEHHPLVPGPDLFLFIPGTLFGFIRFIHPLGDVRRLFVDGNQYPAGGSIEAVFGPVVADIDHRLPSDFSNVHITTGGNFSYNMDLAGGHQGFAGNPGIRVLFQDGIQHSIRDLIGNFVRMAFRDRFRRKNFFHCFLLTQKKYSQK